jgi:hypothetical protein
MFRVPDNRANERTTKGDQPYEDERETLAQNQDQIETEADEFAERAAQREPGESQRRLEEESQERFEEIAEQTRKGSAS